MVPTNGLPAAKALSLAQFVRFAWVRRPRRRRGPGRRCRHAGHGDGRARRWPKSWTRRQPNGSTTDHHLHMQQHDELDHHGTTTTATTCPSAATTRRRVDGETPRTGTARQATPPRPLIPVLRQARVPVGCMSSGPLAFTGISPSPVPYSCGCALHHGAKLRFGSFVAGRDGHDRRSTNQCRRAGDRDFSRSGRSSFDWSASSRHRRSSCQWGTPRARPSDRVAEGEAIALEGGHDHGRVVHPPRTSGSGRPASGAVAVTTMQDRTHLSSPPPLTPRQGHRFRPRRWKPRVSAWFGSNKVLERVASRWSPAR